MIDQGLLEEPTPATQSPFTAVIVEYRRHAAKVARKGPKEMPTTRRFRNKDVPVEQRGRVQAAFYYLQQATDLETR